MLAFPRDETKPTKDSADICEFMGCKYWFRNRSFREALTPEGHEEALGSVSRGHRFVRKVDGGTVERVSPFLGEIRYLDVRPGQAPHDVPIGEVEHGQEQDGALPYVLNVSAVRGSNQRQSLYWRMERCSR